MIQVASELLSGLGDGQDDMRPARRVRVALAIVVSVVLANLAAVVTTLVQG